MTFGSDGSISKGKVGLEQVPFYVEIIFKLFYFGIFIQSSVAQLVTQKAYS